MCGLAFALSYLPVLFYSLFVWWLDRYEKEPKRLIFAAFFWGMLPAVVLAVLAEVALEPPIEEGLFRDLITGSLIAPIAEETAKGLFLLLLFWFQRQEIDSLYDGFLYGSLVGFGFEAAEDFFYLIAAGEEGGKEALLGLAFLRVGLFGLSHAVFTGFTGLGLAAARLSRDRIVRLVAPAGGWGTGVALHAFHNGILSVLGHLEASTEITIFGFLSVVAANWMGLLMVLLLAGWGLYRERIWITRYLREEVNAGILPEPLYHECRSVWRRGVRRGHALLRGNWREWRRLGHLYGVAIELAFRKHQREALGETRWEPEIARLRQELARLTQGRV
ncbi:MAG TPA: PrsW family intramembrane metalloprotease [Thermoflexus sp.]|nr:PrsW family intramembrane metalloprotease [Thermoflexus sp.]